MTTAPELLVIEIAAALLMARLLPGLSSVITGVASSMVSEPMLMFAPRTVVL